MKFAHRSGRIRRERSLFPSRAGAPRIRPGPAPACGEVHALVHLRPVRALCGDAAGAAEACDRALALARRVDDPWLEACALFRSAFTLGLSGDRLKLACRPAI